MFILKLKNFLWPITLILLYSIFVLCKTSNKWVTIFSIIIICVILITTIKLNTFLKNDKGLELKNNILMGALDSSIFALMVFDKSFNCIFINDLAALLFQNKIKTFSDIITNLNQDEKVKEALLLLKEKAYSTKSNYVDVSILEKEFIWWRVSLNPLKTDPNLLLLTITDITPSPKYIQDFDNNPSFLKNCIDKSPIGIFCVNENNEIIFCNNHLLKILETTKEKLIYTKVDQTIKNTQPLNKLRGNEQILHASVIKDGAQQHLLIHNMFSSDSITAYAVIEERRNSTILQALNDSKAYFDYIFEDAPLGIVITDGPEIISASNNTFKQLVGSNNVDNVSIFDFIHEDYRLELKQELYKVATSKNYQKKHIEISLKIEKKNTIVVYLDRLKGGFNEASSIVVYFMDISDFKELESQLIQSQKMQAIGQLAGGIAHDFNNLLTAMIGYSDLLLSRYSPSDPSFNDVMQIKQNANRASNLTKQLLAFSRQQTLQAKIIDITEVLAEISLLLQRLIGPQITLEVNYCKNPVPIKVDEMQIEQVLINLAVNARDAMNQEGTLSIRTSNFEVNEEMKIHDITLPKGFYLLLEIIDTGKGIPEEYSDRIFDPFFSTKEKGQGTGLGLATVYGIIKQTGGFITFDSVVGKGTNFKIFFPGYKGISVQNKNADTQETKQYLQDLTGNGTILLVEDEDPVRSFSARALREKGYKIIEASSGEEAIKIINETKESIDLIITDVIMPKMDGVELVNTIRNNLNNNNIKVIFISGYTEDKFKDILEKDNITYFLPKPFTLKDLAAKVKKVLDL